MASDTPESDLPWGQMERLRPLEFEEILRRAPVAYLPWGALEYHSYHNPIGLDGLKAHGLLLELAKACGGVVLPPVYAGHATIKTILAFNHTVEHKAETVKTLAGEFLRELVDVGFRAVVLLTGHYSEAHVEAVVAAAREAQAELPDARIWALPDSEPLDGLFQKNHAARGETSFQLHFDSTLVDLGRLPADRCTTLEGDGVWGEDPRDATAEEGRRMVDAFLDYMVPRVRELLSSPRPESHSMRQAISTSMAFSSSASANLSSLMQNGKA